jgi:hypothetical protein
MFKLTLATLQKSRIKYKRQAVDLDNDTIEKAKRTKKKFDPIIPSTGNTI